MDDPGALDPSKAFALKMASLTDAILGTLRGIQGTLEENGLKEEAKSLNRTLAAYEQTAQEAFRLADSSTTPKSTLPATLPTQRGNKIT
jgi:hypothetical protein